MCVLLPKEHIIRTRREKRSRIVRIFMSYEMLAKCFRCCYSVTVIEVSSAKIVSIQIVKNY